MSIYLYVQCGIMFLLGEGIYLFWIKFPSFKEKAASINKPFKYSEWWDCDKNLIIGLNLLAVSLFFGLDQLLHFKPAIMDYTKWFFWLIGYTGCNIVFNKMSQFAKGQLKLGDIKSNIADLLTGGTTTVAETIQKGNEVTNQDVTKPPIK